MFLRSYELKKIAKEAKNDKNEHTVGNTTVQGDRTRSNKEKMETRAISGGHGPWGSPRAIRAGSLSLSC